MVRVPREPEPRASPGETAELLRALGHEVGNLLAAIRLSAHLLRTGEAGGAGAADIEELAARAGVLLALIRPLLQPARDADRARLDAEELLAGLVRALEDHRKGKERLSLTAAVPALPVVRADADALHHALVAVVLGALEASRPDGVVRVAALRRADELVISVEDESEPVGVGPGLPLGRALDLRLAEAVVRREGGRLTTSPGGKGTRVELVLPGLPES